MKLCPRIGAVSFVVSRFVYSSKPICDRYPNRPKNHKLEWAVLVEEGEKVLRQITPEILVYIFCYTDFPDQQFYDEKL